MIGLHVVRGLTVSLVMATASWHSPAAGEEPATQHSEMMSVTVSDTKVWPDPEDGGESVTVTLTVHQPGEFYLHVQRGRGYIAQHRFGELAVGTYSWSWDAVGAASEGWWDVEVAGYGVRQQVVNVPVEVRYAAQEGVYPDRYAEYGAGAVDIKALKLRNAPDYTRVEIQMWNDYRRKIFSATAAVDTGARRGYLVNWRRTPRGPKATLALAVLASDEGRPERVRCPRLDITLEKRSVVMTVPRPCMRVGGRSARASAWTGGRDGSHDFALDRRYWTPVRAFEPVRN